MHSIRGLLHVLLIPWFASLCAISVQAQSAETIEKFTQGPHIGPAEEAIVGVEVIYTAEGAETLIRRGNGFLLRCDGFVLLPSSLFSRPPEQAGKVYTGKVHITFSPGTEQARKVGTILPLRIRTDVRYGVVKLDNVHIPAVRTLLPDALEPGENLDLVWSAWDDAAKRFLSPQRCRIPLGKREALTAQSAGTLALSELPSGIPPGAVVIGPETLAVGMLTSNQAGRFATMENLDKVTNCVTPLAVTEADFAKKRAILTRLAEREPEFNEDLTLKEQAPEPTPGMVAVPGGPVHPTPAVLSLQKDMLKATTACVAPFLIDKYEVTNGQYLAFWRTLPERTRSDPRFQEDFFPLAWADTEPFFPDGLTDNPVLGVTYEAAKAYAKWVGKRLPTPYEWSLAAFGPTGGNELPEWANRYVADRQKTWREVVEAHVNYIQQHPALLEQYEIARRKLLTGNAGAEYGEILTVKEIEPGKTEKKERQIPLYFSEPILRELYLPWYFYRPEHISSVVWSRDTVRRAVAPLFDSYQRPQHVLATGARKFDVSPYGAHDMALNANELVCPSPEMRQESGADYYMRVKWRQPEIWSTGIANLSNRGVTPFLPWFYSLHADAGSGFGSGHSLLLSRRLRSTTSNAGRDETVWPRQQPRLVAASNIYEITSMLSPLVGWDVCLTSGQTVNTGALGTLYLGFSPLADGPNDAPTSPRPRWLKTYEGIIPDPLVWFRWGSAGVYTRIEALWAGQSMIWDEAASFSWWKDMPAYYVEEMGRPYDTDAPEGRNLPRIPPTSKLFEKLIGRPSITTPPPWHPHPNLDYETTPGVPEIKQRPWDTYLIPGGFRCVR